MCAMRAGGLLARSGLLERITLSPEGSRFTRDTLIETVGVPPAKIELISNGVDLGRFTPRPKRSDLPARYGLEGRNVLLIVRRLCERKGRSASRE